jgi:hypothetical protein
MIYAYPKARHERTQTPRQYKDYGSYKRFLRAEFFGKCIYCREPDSHRGRDQFGADHYRPKVLFPELEVSYSNLFYCCNSCNSRKGNYWPAGDEADARFIPNPCAHVMFSHLKFKHGEVEARSDAGRFTVELLDLNDPEYVEYRENQIHMEELATSRMRDIEETEFALQAAFNDGALSADQLAEAKSDLSRERGKTSRVLEQLRGENEYT